MATIRKKVTDVITGVSETQGLKGIAQARIVMLQPIWHAKRSTFDVLPMQELNVFRLTSI
jgi:hypothetical protein